MEIVLIIAGGLVHIITTEMHFKEFFFDTRLQSFVILVWLFILILLQKE